MPAAERFFAADHPTAPGHFPGNPVIPGALLLSETLQAITASHAVDPWPRGRLVSAKFLHPARPGDNVSIEFTVPVAGRIKFACSVAGTTVLTGTVCEAP